MCSKLSFLVGPSCLLYRRADLFIVKTYLNCYLQKGPSCLSNEGRLVYFLGPSGLRADMSCITEIVSVDPNYQSRQHVTQELSCICYHFWCSSQLFVDCQKCMNQIERAKTGWLRIRIMCPEQGDMSIHGLWFQCSFSLMLHAQWRSNKYQFQSSV